MCALTRNSLTHLSNPCEKKNWVWFFSSQGLVLHEWSWTSKDVCNKLSIVFSSCNFFFYKYIFYALIIGFEIWCLMNRHFYFRIGRSEYFETSFSTINQTAKCIDEQRNIKGIMLSVVTYLKQLNFYLLYNLPGAPHIIQPK